MQRKPADAHMGAVTQVDQPPAHPSGNGAVVFAGGNQCGVGSKVILQAFLFRVNDALGQYPSAAADGSAAVQQNILAVWPGGMVQLPRIQQAAVTLLLGSFKAAPDARQIVLRVIAALQHSTLIQKDRDMAVQVQSTCQVAPGRKIHFVRLGAVIQRFLQHGGVQRLAVPFGTVGGTGHVQTAALRRGSDAD